MEKFATVPVVDVHEDNLEMVWPGLIESIKAASFIALDTELSGLGDRKKLMAKSVEDRYKYMTEVTSTRAILTLGISCFKKQTTDCLDSKLDSQSCGHTDTQDNDYASDQINAAANGGMSFKVTTFNLSVLCSQEFVVEPGSLQFLVQHGFDFNKQYSKGIPYSRGNDKEPHNYTTSSVRNLFIQLMLANKPIVLHNGFFDLLYLYQNFYAVLPDKLEVFTSDIFEMFTAGVIDTKYVAEYQIREPASYLGYIFRKSQRYNTSCQAAGQPNTEVVFSYDDTYSQWVEHLCCYAMGRGHKDRQTLQVCDKYAAHGFCHKGFDCPLSHDMDMILDKDNIKAGKSARKKRKRRKRNHPTGESESNETFASEETLVNNNSPIADQTTSNMETTEIGVSTFTQNYQQMPEYSSTCKVSQLSLNRTEDNPNDLPSSMDAQCSVSEGKTAPADTRTHTMSGGHRAGIDAFMTGYCLATYLVQSGQPQVQHTDWLNKVSLSGKEMPLSIVCSHFSRPSTAHSQKLKLIKETLGLSM